MVVGHFVAHMVQFERLYKRYFQKAVEEYAFTPNEISVLMFLSNNAPYLDTARDIVRFKGISKGLVAQSVRSLEEKGYVNVVQDPLDRRVFHLELSESSEDIVKRLRESEQILSQRLQTGISKRDWEITQRTMRRILQNIDTLGKEDQLL